VGQKKLNASGGGQVPSRRKVDPAAGFRLSIGVFALIAIAAIAIAALVVYAARGTVEVVVAARGVERFERITTADLTTSSVSSQDLGDDAARDPAQIAGGVALRQFGAGETIDRSGATPPIQGAVGRVRLEVVPDQSHDLRPRPGERVRLLLSPAGPGVRPTGLCALILAVPAVPEGSPQPYVVAVGRSAAKKLQVGLGRSLLLLARIG
jgi:Chaperone for flagella basal body P-ring formation